MAWFEMLRPPNPKAYNIQIIICLNIIILLELWSFTLQQLSNITSNGKKYFFLWFLNVFLLPTNGAISCET